MLRLPHSGVLAEPCHNSWLSAALYCTLEMERLTFKAMRNKETSQQDAWQRYRKIPAAFRYQALPRSENIPSMAPKWECPPMELCLRSHVGPCTHIHRSNLCTPGMQKTSCGTHRDTSPENAERIQRAFTEHSKHSQSVHRAVIDSIQTNPQRMQRACREHSQSTPRA